MYTVIDTISYPVQNVPFPAITVCPPGLDRWAFLEKVMNYIKFQCYKDYLYSEKDCLESKQVRDDFSFLFERIHQLALDATMKKINVMNDTELEYRLYRYIGKENGTNNWRFSTATEALFRKILHYASPPKNSTCPPVKTVEEKLTKFILYSIGRINHIGEYLTELEGSIDDEECNKTLPDKISMTDLSDCVKTHSCKYWLKLGLAYIDLHSIYGDYLIWDLGSIVAYFSPILSKSKWELSKDEVQLHNFFKNIYRTLTSSNSTLSAYDAIALLGFDENKMKPHFIPSFQKLPSVLNETSFQFRAGKWQLGCYIGSYDRKWQAYIKKPNEESFPCSNASEVEQGEFTSCCRIRNDLKHSSRYVMQLMKYAQYPPHIVDQNEIEPYNLTIRPDFLKQFGFKYSAYKGRSYGNFEREISEPLIPFCALNSKWEALRYGSYGERSYCSAFAPSLTDKGICYSWNTVDYSKLFAKSEYTDQMDSIFRYKTKRRPIAYPQANGPNYGFSFIIDTHTTTSRFKEESNTNTNVDVVIHEGEDQPYFKYAIISINN